VLQCLVEAPGHKGLDCPSKYQHYKHCLQAARLPTYLFQLLLLLQSTPPPEVRFVPVGAQAQRRIGILKRLPGQVQLQPGSRTIAAGSGMGEESGGKE